MAFSDVKEAKKYASIAEVAAAQAKLSESKLAEAPNYAEQARQSAEEALQYRNETQSLADSAAVSEASAGNYASQAAEYASQAESAAQNVFASSVHAPIGETLTTLPTAINRSNTVLVFNSSGDNELRSANTFASLDSSGKIPVSQIPSIALTEPFVVSSQSEMLALDAQVGDIAKRTDLGYSFCLASAPASVLSNWVQLTDDVLAQLGQSTGAIQVGAVDDSGNPTTVQGALNLKVPTSALTSTSAASEINTQSGMSVQSELDSLNVETDSLSVISLKEMPIKFSELYKEVMVAGQNPQALAEDSNYWYVTVDVSVDPNVTYLCNVIRINKTTKAKDIFPTTFNCHGQGVGVLGSGQVFIGGNTNSNITIVDFNSSTSSQVACTGFFKDFPFCYNPTNDTIYQLQDSNATSARITRVSIIRRTSGFVSEFNVDQSIISGGYPQGITTDGSSLYICSGASWALSTGGAWNDKWYLYRTSFGGVILDKCVYTKQSMGQVIGGGVNSAISGEPQGIFMYKGTLSFLQYIALSSASYWVIFNAASAGSQVRSTNRNSFVSLTGLDSVGVSSASLSSGSAIATIAAAMPDGSMLSFQISSDAALTSDTGIQFGTCVVFRLNANRIYAVTTEQSSTLSSTTPSPKLSYVYVYGAYQSPPMLSLQVKASISSDYSSTSVATTGSIAISSIPIANRIYIHITNTSSTNPVTVYTLTRQEIDYYISNSISLLMVNGASTASISLTSTGITVNTVTGSPIIRRVLSQ